MPDSDNPTLRQRMDDLRQRIENNPQLDGRPDLAWIEIANGIGELYDGLATLDERVSQLEFAQGVKG